MPSDRAFRLSMYLALGLSCLCVGYSEWDLLPEASVFTGVVILLLVISYRTGPRFELGLAAANRLGLVIGLVTAVWMAYQFINKNSLIYTLPWPASLLPYIGTLLMFLIPAKLFRPKHIGDWWALQGMGMAGTALASSMADDAMFGVLLGLYSLVGLWSLTLFFFRRVAGHLPPIPNTTPLPLATVVSGYGERPGRRNLFRAAGWLLLAIGICLPLFLITPRTDAPRFQMGKGRLETGYSVDQMIDLTRTGDLQANREVSFVVTAIRPDGQPKTDLNPNQRWRGTGYNQYMSGRWKRTDVTKSIHAVGTKMLEKGATPENPYRPPNFGPESYTLEFVCKLKSTSWIVADPVAWEAGRHSPIAVTTPGEPVRPWFQNAETAFQSLTTIRPLESRYVQLARPYAAPNADPPDTNLGPPFELTEPTATAIYTPERIQPADVNEAIPVYRAVRSARLRTWTHDLLERLAAKDPVIRAALNRVVDRVTLRIDPEDYEAVARALANHLANSGEYAYTTKLRRDDKSLDPIEEFLYKTKEGHCQRYAAGLTLMLRSVGIPANYVLGYKGCEHEGDGVYLIREEFAHAWVEVLISRPVPPGYPRDPQAAKPIAGRPERVWHWLSLDPTPDLSNETEDTSWFGSARLTGIEFFRNFIVGYTPERRQKILDTTEEWVTENWWLAVAAVGLVGSGFGLRAALRRRRLRLAGLEPETGVAWYDAYRHVVAAHGYQSKDGRTPHEQAAVISQALAAQPATATVAEIPLEITRAFYLTRYAHRPPTPEQQTKLAASLDRLTEALRTAPRPG